MIPLGSGGVDVERSGTYVTVTAQDASPFVQRQSVGHSRERCGWLLDKWEWKGGKAKICRCTLKACNPEAKKEEEAMAPGPHGQLSCSRRATFLYF